MGVTGHSRLGASSCARWTACPGSVKLIESLGYPNVETRYAAEGTVAHSICENYLRFDVPEVAPKDNGQLGEKIEQGEFEIEITQEMIESATTYANLILNDMVAAGLVSKGSQRKHPIDATFLFIEQQFDLNYISPDLGGTNDASVWNPHTKKLTVYDFKYGKGIPVEAIENKQLMFYALGVINKLRIIPDTIELCIVQPRCFHEDGPIRRWELSYKELQKFEDELSQAVIAVKQGNVFESGAHCKWCSAKSVCPKIREQVNEACQMTFAPVETETPVLEPPTVEALTIEQISHIMKLIPTVESFIESVQERAKELLNQGVEIPGFKLVQKRATRKWVDEDEVRAAFGEQAVELKVKSPAQLEKIVGKEAVAEYVTLSEPGVTIAPESDKRQAVVPVQQAFDCLDTPMDI